jgi:hypothetical protein
MDYRARKELGQNVPKKSKTPTNSKPAKTWDSGKGGRRKGAGRKPEKAKIPSALDGEVKDIVEDIKSLKYRLIGKKGFLGDIQSKTLQMELKKELECLQGHMEKILKEYQEFGY